MKNKLAKITNSAIQRKIITQYGETKDLTSGEKTELLIKKFKREVKKEQIIEYFNMHRYHCSKKEKRIAKAKIRRMSK